MKILFLIIIFFSGTLLIFVPNNPLDSQPSMSDRVAYLWKKDLENIKKTNEFPNESEISRINYIPNNPLAQSLLIKSSPNLEAKGDLNAKYDLDITLLAWSQKDRGLVVQYELFHGKKRKKIWEFARTFTF